MDGRTFDTPGTRIPTWRWAASTAGSRGPRSISSTPACPPLTAPERLDARPRLLETDAAAGCSAADADLAVHSGDDGGRCWSSSGACGYRPQHVDVGAQRAPHAGSVDAGADTRARS